MILDLYESQLPELMVIFSRDAILLHAPKLNNSLNALPTLVPIQFRQQSCQGNALEVPKCG
jgi:hypothetical protein